MELPCDVPVATGWPTYLRPEAATVGLTQNKKTKRLTLGQDNITTTLRALEAFL